MAERVEAWRGADGQLYETEAAAEAAELKAAAEWLSRCNPLHLLSACTGKTIDHKTEDALNLLTKELRAAKRRAAEVTP